MYISYLHGVLNHEMIGFSSERRGVRLKEEGGGERRREKKKKKAGGRSTGPFFSHILGWSHLRLPPPPLAQPATAWITAINPSPLIETIVINYRI